MEGERWWRRERGSELRAATTNALPPRLRPPLPPHHNVHAGLVAKALEQLRAWAGGVARQRAARANSRTRAVPSHPRTCHPRQGGPRPLLTLSAV